LENFRGWQVNFMRVYLHFCEVFLLPSCEPERPRDTEGAAGGHRKGANEMSECGGWSEAEPVAARFLPQAKMAPDIYSIILAKNRHKQLKMPLNQ